jgi:hypothetical protein
MDTYLLPTHVHVCRRGDDFVFLDLRQDDYTLVNGEAAAALRASLFDGSDTAYHHSVGTALQQLLDGGLLTTSPTSGKPLAVADVEIATEQLLEPESVPEARMTPGTLLNFFAACSRAAIRLRWSHLEQTIGAIRKRNAQHATDCIDIARARELTATFYKLRALFPFNYLCLFDSLALIEFLARYRIHPTWVFGVRLAPWGAHCWVQHGSFVFNEGVEEAARYTPIMAI